MPLAAKVIETGMYWKYKWEKQFDQTEKEAKVCLVQVREPGLPDKFMKIGPATDIFELVDTTNQPGQERFAVVEEMVRMHAPRQKVLPKWTRMHTNVKESAAPDLGLEDVPEVCLENIVFEVQHPEGHIPLPTPTNRMDGFEKRMGSIESALTTLAQTTSSLSRAVDLLISKETGGKTTAQNAPVPENMPEKRGPGRPRKA